MNNNQLCHLVKNSDKNDIHNCHFWQVVFIIFTDIPVLALGQVLECE
jgi:hypothetical protein